MRARSESKAEARENRKEQVIYRKKSVRRAAAKRTEKYKTGVVLAPTFRVWLISNTQKRKAPSDKRIFQRHEKSQERDSWSGNNSLPGASTRLSKIAPIYAFFGKFITPTKLIQIELRLQGFFRPAVPETLLTSPQCVPGAETNSCRNHTYRRTHHVELPPICASKRLRLVSAICPVSGCSTFRGC